MGEKTGYPQGTFSWVDLGTTDTDAAKDFYGGLFGWQFDDMPVGDGSTYTMCSVNGKQVAALARQSDQERGQGIPPHWNNYITVDDVDAIAPRVSALNGNLLMPPFDVLEAGRMALGSDPTGGVFALWEPRNHIGAALVNVPGAFTWNELGTTDVEAAKQFYSDLLGWTYEELEGSDLPYEVIINNGRSNGGIRPLGPEEQGLPSYWSPYFGTASTEQTGKRAIELGGKVVVETIDVPNGRFAAIADPQGAFFAVFEGEFDD